jgi:hypothetical protein
MLKITKKEGSATKQLWVLCGGLTGPWVGELRSNWDARDAPSTTLHVVDLSDVTSIDEGGEALLRDMKHGGARFVARGVETRHILDNLKSKGPRPMRRFLAHLDCPCGHQLRHRQEKRETR